ncbi:hypothetical protein Glove_84g22 [Diversispora epigaea]|uniref:Uncharacterized protein n=1 Tax=Diversispora epigaea TaxID=1348612 RepID=A0A397JH40_9GLOM|nr:hypothetical protein Glove_84g22 [Diversispora epigaea]
MKSAFGTCNECHQNNIGFNWCHPCNAKQFQNEFGKWTSKDREIDEFIQQIQLNTNKLQEIIEWIPFDILENVTYLAKGGLGTIKNQLKFRGKNSIAIYDITKNPTENEYIIVINYAKYDFHSGNIVNQTLTENNPENIYGVIRYMAPETTSDFLSKISINISLRESFEECAIQLYHYTPQDEIDKGTICLFANKSDPKELFAALYNLDEECLEKLNLEFERLREIM